MIIEYIQMNGAMLNWVNSVISFSNPIARVSSLDSCSDRDY